MRPASAPLTTGIDEVAGGEPRLHVLGDEELQEVGRLLRRALGDQPAGDAAERIGRLALAAGHDREVEPADLVFAETDLVGGERALQMIDGADRKRHRGLAVAEIADRLRILEAEEAVLERLQIDELLEQLAGLLEGLAREAAVFAPQRRIERRPCRRSAPRDASSRNAAAICRRRQPRSA